MEIQIEKQLFIKILIGILLILIVGIAIIFMNKPQAEKVTISMGAVDLNVKDLNKMKEFYEDIVGLQELNSSEDFAELGFEGNPIVRLYQQDGFETPSATEAGLYHSAIVFSDRAFLAKTIEHVIEQRPDLYQGSADHISTEAFYFTDPEGNGLELYFDKPKTDWVYDENGMPTMGSTYIDHVAYIAKYTNEAVESEKSTMGHVHLKVGNILEAKKFYVDILRFDVITEMPQALFISRDNYHHHIGMNTWESAGANKREQNKYGLRSFTINFHDSKEFEDVKNSIEQSGSEFELKSDNEIEVQDPWDNVVKIVLKD